MTHYKRNFTTSKGKEISIISTLPISDTCLELYKDITETPEEDPSYPEKLNKVRATLSPKNY